MKAKKHIPIALLCIMLFSGCIKEIQPPLRNTEPILVVEGSISTDSVPYVVRLTYSGQYEIANNLPDEYIEEEAVVFIRDQSGVSTRLDHTGEGYYRSNDPSFVGEAGKSYQLDITLKNGKRFISAPETIPPKVPIDSVTVEFIPEFNQQHPTYFRAYVHAKDPAATENFYKWEFYSYTTRQTLGVGCGFACIMYEFCFQRISDNELNLLSDQAINGNSITGIGVGNSYIFAFGRHYMNISQLSLTREAYQFWQRYADQVNRTGSIFDPLPASIKGNIYNESDTNEFALGYFSAHSVTHKRVIVVPFYITQYQLDVSAGAFFHKENVPCFEHYPNTLYYPPPPADQAPPPPGWEQADTIQVRFTF